MKETCSDIGYETDLTEVDAEKDADEDDGGMDHDISDFAELFSDYEHSSNYPTRFPSSQAALLPRVPTMVWMERRWRRRR